MSKKAPKADENNLIDAENTLNEGDEGHDGPSTPLNDEGSKKGEIKEMFTEAQQEMLEFYFRDTDYFFDEVLLHHLPRWGGRVILAFLEDVEGEYKDPSAQDEFENLIEAMAQAMPGMNEYIFHKASFLKNLQQTKPGEDYYKAQLKVLEKWLREQTPAVSVAYVTDNRGSECYDFYDQEIIINRKNTYETQVYTLLHECGHFILKNDEEDYNKRFPYDDYNNENQISSDEGEIEKLMKKLRKRRLKGQHTVPKKEFKGLRSATYCHILLREEMTAWTEGESLAKTLNIILDKRRYDLYTEKSIDSYLYWALMERDPRVA